MGNDRSVVGRWKRGYFDCVWRRARQTPLRRTDLWFGLDSGVRTQLPFWNDKQRGSYLLSILVAVKCTGGWDSGVGPVTRENWIVSPSTMPL